MSIMMTGKSTIFFPEEIVRFVGHVYHEFAEEFKNDRYMIVEFHISSDQYTVDEEGRTCRQTITPEGYTVLSEKRNRFMWFEARDLAVEVKEDRACLCPTCIESDFEENA